MPLTTECPFDSGKHLFREGSSRCGKCNLLRADDSVYMPDYFTGAGQEHGWAHYETATTMCPLDGGKHMFRKESSRCGKCNLPRAGDGVWRPNVDFTDEEMRPAGRIAKP